MTRPDITKGPWKSHLGRGASPRFHIQTGAGYPIASTTELSKHVQASNENSMRQANAEAIAAVPDLLVALEKALSLLECANDHQRAAGRLEYDTQTSRDALTKAGYTF